MVELGCATVRTLSIRHSPMNADTDTTPPTDTTTPTVRSDALTRASALASRSRDLRRAQVEVQDLTAREVQVMARTAASFFDAIPLSEFNTSLLPTSARLLRRMRHRILHRTVHTTATTTTIHAMLLGRDGVLRLFSARTADSRDLLLSLEPRRGLPPTVVRDVVEWEPTLRVTGFRPFEVLERLSGSLDAVEQQITDAEVKVHLQKEALVSGDLKALLPVRAENPPQLESATRAPLDTAAPPAASSRYSDDEPEEWDEPEESAQPVAAPIHASLLPVLAALTSGR
jgi:hypothetical protein